MSSAPTPSNPGSNPAAASPPAPVQATPIPLAPPQPTTPVSGAGSRATDQIVVYRHSNMFYWWPVWVFGFAFALITYFHNQHLAVVPAETRAAHQRDVDVDGNGKMEKRDVLILDAKQKLHTKTDEGGNVAPVQPTISVSHYRWLGSIYAIVLLFVITITNVSVRGLWTVFFFVLISMLAIMLAVSGWSGAVFEKINQLSIFINLGGYILISTVLFILWSVNFFLFDRQTYMIFTPGQVRVRLEIGGEETVYDTTGMVIQRERGDLLRHWVLGFGSGDVVIKPVGRPNPLLFPNVLRVEKIVAHIELMMKEKVVIGAQDQKQ